MTCYYQTSYKSMSVKYDEQMSAHTSMQKCTLSKVCTETTLPYYQTEMYIVQGVH